MPYNWNEMRKKLIKKVEKPIDMEVVIKIKTHLPNMNYLSKNDYWKITDNPDNSNGMLIYKGIKYPNLFPHSLNFRATVLDVLNFLC